MHRTLPFLLAAVACGSPPAPAGVAIRDSAGTEIVTDFTDHTDTYTALSISDTPSLVITNEALGYPGGIASAVRLDDGTVVVVPYRGSLRRFGPTGELLHEFAGPGEGPGEFLRVSGIAPRGDSVLVYSGSPSFKTTLFDSSGRLVWEQSADQEKWRSLGAWRECGHAKVFPDGARIACTEKGSGPRPSRPVVGLERARRRLALISPELDSVRLLSLDLGIESFAVDIGQELPYSLVHPFHARTVLGIDHSGSRIAVISNPEYTIEVWNRFGKLERIIRRPNARRAPTDRERAWADSILRVEEMMNAGEPADSARAERALAGFQAPTLLPAASAVSVSSVGDIWVQRPGFPWTAPREWDIYSPDGRLLGRIKTPSGLYSITDVGRDYVLGISIDDDWVQSVVMYTLIRVEQ